MWFYVNIVNVFIILFQFKHFSFNLFQIASKAKLSINFSFISISFS